MLFCSQMYIPLLFAWEAQQLTPRKDENFLKNGYSKSIHFITGRTHILQEASKPGSKVNREFGDCAIWVLFETFNTIFAKRICDRYKRCVCNNWHKPKRNFSSLLYVRSSHLLYLLPLHQKNVHVMKFQMNRSVVAKKLDKACEKLHQQDLVHQIFGQDVTRVTQGKDSKGVSQLLAY